MSSELADSVIARTVDQRDLMASMLEHCKSISARVTSRDRSVSVEVDGLGAMTGLWLGEFTERLSTLQQAPLIRRAGSVFEACAPRTER
jgi:hypothetical protein